MKCHILEFSFRVLLAHIEHPKRQKPKAQQSHQKCPTSSYLFSSDGSKVFQSVGEVARHKKLINKKRIKSTYGN
jgi:hypothetical protein